MLRLFSLSAALTCAGFLCLRRAWGRNKVVNVVPSALVLCFPVAGSVTGVSVPNFRYFASFLEMSFFNASMDVAASKIDLCSSSGCVSKTACSGASSDSLLIDFIISLGLLDLIEASFCLTVVVYDSSIVLTLSLVESASGDRSIMPPLGGASITFEVSAIFSFREAVLTLNGFSQVGRVVARTVLSSSAVRVGYGLVGGLVPPKWQSSFCFSSVTRSTSLFSSTVVSSELLSELSSPLRCVHSFCSPSLSPLSGLAALRLVSIWSSRYRMRRASWSSRSARSRWRCFIFSNSDSVGDSKLTRTLIELRLLLLLPPVSTVRRVSGVAS